MATAALGEGAMIVHGGEIRPSKSQDGKPYAVTYEVFLYDVVERRWFELLTANPVRRVGHAMCVCEGQVWMFGGRSGPLPLTKPMPREMMVLSMV